MPTVRKEGSRYVFTSQQKKNIIRLYKEEVPMKSGIAPLYSVSGALIIGRLVEWGIHAPKRKARAMPLNEDYFKPPHTPESMYWGGMLLADGSVAAAGMTRSRIQLTLAGTQRHMVQRFKWDIGSGYAITIWKEGRGGGNRKQAWGHKILSDKIAGDLAEHFGIFPNKTGSERVIQKIQEHKHARHFMRGFFDGDGSVHKTRNRISLSAGSDSVHVDLEYYFGCPWHCEMRKSSSGGVGCRMSVNGDRARMVAQHLYGDLGGYEHPRLTYKHKRAQRIIASGHVPDFPMNYQRGA